MRQALQVSLFDLLSSADIYVRSMQDLFAHARTKHTILLADVPGTKEPAGEQTSSSQQHNGVEITEVAATPSGENSPSGNSSPAPWKPPAIPQPSLKLGKRTKSEASSTA